MNSHSFGEDLAQARELNGLTISQVSEALRIRRSVIVAIEQGNFASLPAKGFTRNQISAYARFLGLNSADIVNRFLHAYTTFESSNLSSQIPINESQRYKQKQNDETREFQKAPHRSGKQERVRKDLADYHVLPDDDHDETARRRAIKQEGHGKKTTSSQGYGVTGRKLGSNFSEKGYPPSRRRNMSSGGSIMRNRIILVLIVVALAALAIFLIPRCVCATPEVANASAEEAQSVADAAGKIPVSGIANSEMKVITDSETPTTDANADSAAPTETFNLLVAAQEGLSTYMEIKIDDKTLVADDVKGPINETYVVTKNATITSGTKKNLVISINGVSVPLKSTSGMYRAKLTVKSGKVVIS
jgi:cytoskeletal protein RodZ